MRDQWRGQTVVILGGGPSLNGTALRHIGRARFKRQCRAIAVNDAVYVAPWADWLHAADSKWWRANIDYVQRFWGFRSSVDQLPRPWGVQRYELTGVRGYDRRRWRVRGTNGGYQALHCAIDAGAARILLVGFDMHGAHWFDGAVTDTDYASVMAPYFKSLGRVLKAREIEVLNCSPGSALTCFPFADLGKVFGPAGFRTGAGNPARLSPPGLH